MIHPIGDDPAGEALRPRVLLVDDDATLLRVNARALQQVGYAVETAPDAERALSSLRRAPVDVVVSDIQMGKMSGMDLVAAMKAEGLDIPVILITGRPDVATAIQAVEYGVVRYVPKPVDPSTLARSVGEAIRRHGMARIEQLARDNAALRSLVDELTRAKAAADAGIRAKNVFLSKMGHELRTPMTTVIGMTELVLATALTNEQRQDLECVRAAGESLMHVIAQVLDLADLAGGTLVVRDEAFDLRGTLQRTIDARAAAAAARDLSLALEVGPDVPTDVVGDPVRVAQVLDLLLDNAIKFTPKGGVTVRVDIESPPDASRVRVGIAVIDTGIGIAPHAMRRVLDAFSQGDDSATRPYGGAGLGLAIASQLAALLDGRLDVDSAPDAGTTVRFTVGLRRVVAADDFLVVDAFA